MKIRIYKTCTYNVGPSVFTLYCIPITNRRLSRCKIKHDGFNNLLKVPCSILFWLQASRRVQGTEAEENLGLQCAVELTPGVV